MNTYDVFYMVFGDWDENDGVEYRMKTVNAPSVNDVLARFVKPDDVDSAVITAIDCGDNEVWAGDFQIGS